MFFWFWLNLNLFFNSLEKNWLYLVCNVSKDLWCFINYLCSVLLNVEILLKCEENLVNILCNGVLINMKVIVKY